MTTLFFVHGLWTSPRLWENYQSYFSSLGYRTVAPALPQHFTRNQAQHPSNLGLQDYLDQLEEDYRAIENDAEQIIIIGHAMGCVLAQQLAMRVDPRALILLAPEAPAGIGSAFPPARALIDTAKTPLFWRKGVKPSYSSAREILFNAMDEDQARKAYECLCFESGRALHELWFWYLDPESSAKIEREKIHCPVMTLSGNKDKYSSPRIAKRISRHLGQARFYQRLSGFGHMLPIEDSKFEAARQMHVWLCWQLGLQNQHIHNQASLNTATA